ncbi:MAG: CPBP family intramembrane metalloprotease [Nibricoccus sp.]
MTLTFILLATAIVALWAGGDENSPKFRQQLWLGLWLSSLVVAFSEGVVTTAGAAIAVAFAGIVLAFQKARAPWQVGLAATALLAMAVGLMLHKLPGFHNPLVIDKVRFTPDARPFTLYLNYDKTLVGLFVLGWCHTRIARLRDWKTLFATWLPWTAALVAVLMILSLAMGYVRFAPKFPAESWLWLIVNLLFVCAAEEALFRGFIQTQLQKSWSRWRGGRATALAIASVLFGLAHFWGGWAYVALAIVAGFGYGWIYQRTGRIEASILAHFALNTVHFFLFTYPALATGN